MQLGAIPLIGGFYAALYNHRLFTLTPTSVWHWFALFGVVEFAYYWHHRLSHEVRWFWGTHSVHHSANQINFPAALRLGWTNVLSGLWLLWAPLFFLGFEPRHIVGMLAANLVYQFFLHTEMVRRLWWPVEWLFNTPSHHRAHHGNHPLYLDVNYGGVLIVFDRLFGTFQAELDSIEPSYGLVHPLHSTNPFVIAFHETLAIVRDVRAAPGWRERFLYAFGRPGYSHDGTRMTSVAFRQAYRALTAETRGHSNAGSLRTRHHDTVPFRRAGAGRIASIRGTRVDSSRHRIGGQGDRKSVV